MPVSTSCSPDGTTTDCGHRHLIAAYYSIIERLSRPDWLPIADGLPT